jgi:hypothetical protein
MSKLIVNERELDPKAECELCRAKRLKESLIAGPGISLILCSQCIKDVQAYMTKQN